MTDLQFLATLESVINDRLRNPDESSYTASLARKGVKRIAQKVGEEGVEVALAALGGDDAELKEESADLLYHLLVLLNSRQLTLSDVIDTLEARHRPGD